MQCSRLEILNNEKDHMSKFDLHTSSGIVILRRSYFEFSFSKICMKIANQELFLDTFFALGKLNIKIKLIRNASEK